MKKLSEQLKQYLIRYAKKSLKHNLKRKNRTCSENIFNGKKRGKPHTLLAPINMDLENNYEETVCFFNSIGIEIGSKAFLINSFASTFSSFKVTIPESNRDIFNNVVINHSIRSS